VKQNLRNRCWHDGEKIEQVKPKKLNPYFPVFSPFHHAKACLLLIFQATDGRRGQTTIAFNINKSLIRAPQLYRVTSYATLNITGTFNPMQCKRVRSVISPFAN
jgi:hypothetical protein